MTCYRRDCMEIARHRIVVIKTGWRLLLRRPPRSWQVCDEHRFDPISRRHAGQLHHV